MKILKDFAVWIASKVIGLVAVALVFGVLNLFLVGGQWLWHIQGRAKLKEAETKLSARRQELAKDDGWFEAAKAELDRHEQRTDALDARLAEIRSRMRKQQNTVRYYEENYKGALPPTSFRVYSAALDAYNALVPEHNRENEKLRELGQEYQAALDRYNHRIKAQNTKVDAYNAEVNKARALAQESGSVWYVLPVPELSSRSGHARAAP